MDKELIPFTANNLKLAVDEIREQLTPDLLNREYRARNETSPMFGHCMNAAGCLQQIFGKKNIDLYSAEDKKNYQRFGRGRFYHWWAVDKASGDLIDITADQYKSDRNNLEVIYSNGQRQSSISGFRQYRERVKELTRRVSAQLIRKIGEKTMKQVVVQSDIELSTQELHDVLSEIADGMRGLVNSHITVAKIIAKHSNKSYWNQLESELTERVKWFDPTVLSMFRKIGNHPAISSDNNRDKLPVAYNTLYQLADCDSERLQKALDKGLIGPKTTLAQAKEFRAKDAKSTGKSKSSSTESLSITVKVRFQDGKGKSRSAKQALNALKLSLAKSGATVTWSEF